MPQTLEIVNIYNLVFIEHLLSVENINLAFETDFRLRYQKTVLQYVN